MPHLTKNYLDRYERLRAVCFDSFEARVERPTLLTSDEEQHPLAWRHADLFLGAFPRVRRRQGFEILCCFTQRDDNRVSELLGYSVQGPDYVPDPFDIGTKFDEQNEDALIGTAERDRKILLIPAIPPSCQLGSLDDCPTWLHRDINTVIEDDGTPEGIFERSQLLLWAGEPINRWHSVGYGHHDLLDEFPAALSESMMPSADDEAAPQPSSWLPRVETALCPSDISWASLPTNQLQRFRDRPCKVVRFFTQTMFIQERIEEATVWINDDHWHLERRSVFEGGIGAIP
jgi:hypothetical protein